MTDDDDVNRDSPVYDYADDGANNSCGRSKVITDWPTSSQCDHVNGFESPVIGPTIFADDASSMQETPTATPATHRSTMLSNIDSSSSMVDRNGVSASASSVRTVASSAAATVVQSQSCTPTSPVQVQRNLNSAFAPIEILSPSPAPANASTASVSSTQPTPNTHRTSWPIGYNSKAGGFSSTQKPRSKRKHPSSSLNNFLSLQNESETGSRFGECPVCLKSVALFELDRHAASCTGSSGNDEPTKSKVAKREDGTDVKSKSSNAKGAGAGGSQPMDLSDSVAGSGFARCPVCDASVPAQTINHHLDVECGKARKKGQAATSTIAVPPATHQSEQPVVQTAPTVVAPHEAAPAVPASISPNANSNPVSTPPNAAPAVDASVPMEISPAASTAQDAATASTSSAVAHPFFTSGPRAASAFAPQRRGKNDSVKCAMLSHFTLSHSSAPTSSPLSAFELEWQDCPVPTETAHQPQSCAVTALSPFHTSTKCHEAAVEQWCDVHLHATTSAFLGDSPVVDLHSPSLLCNSTHVRRFKLSPSMLKSLLQKNIRLSRPAAAVRLALQLMHLNLNDFLRRFAVIIVEDAILHPAFPFLVWLTLASGKQNPQCPFQPTIAHINALLQMVHDVACVSTKDILAADELLLEDGKESSPSSQEDEDIGTGLPQGPPTSLAPASLIPPTLLDQLPKLTPQQRVLVKSILTRACFGGSPYDVQMLRSYAAVWTRRFQTENAQVHAGEKPAKLWIPFLHSLYAASPFMLPPKILHSTPVDVRHVTYLQDDDLVLSAIDNHCSPIIEHLLQKPITVRLMKQHGLYEESAKSNSDTLGSLLWQFRGKLTTKQPLRVRQETTKGLENWR